VRLDQAVHLQPAVAPTAPRAMPTSYWLFKAGATSTEYGPVYWTERSAKLCAEAAARRSTEFNFDYDHLSVKPVAVGNGRAAGWSRRDISAAGFRVVAVSWTDVARAAILGREYRYLSPFALVDEATREVVDVINCALTNLPATHGAQLLLAQLAGSKPSPRQTMNPMNPSPGTETAPMPMAEPKPPATSGGAVPGAPSGGLNPEVAEAVVYCHSLIPEGDPLKAALSQWMEQHGVAETSPEMTSMAAKLSLADGVIALTGAKDAGEGAVKVMMLHQKAEAPRTVVMTESKDSVLDRLVRGATVVDAKGVERKVGPKIRAVDKGTYAAMPLSALKAFEAAAPELSTGNVPTTHPRTQITPSRLDIESPHAPASSGLSANAQVFLSAAQTPAGQRAIAIFAKRDGLKNLIPVGLCPEDRN
jgi:hypothetical protein